MLSAAIEAEHDYRIEQLQEAQVRYPYPTPNHLLLQPPVPTVAARATHGCSPRHPRLQASLVLKKKRGTPLQRGLLVKSITMGHQALTLTINLL